MMTGLEWLRSQLSLSDQAELDRVVSSGIVITDGMKIDPNNPGVGISRVLSRLFIWAHTPQGHNFWDDLSKRYTNTATIHVGDFVEALEDFPRCFTKGRIYEVTGVRSSAGIDLLDIKTDDSGRANRWQTNKFRSTSKSAPKPWYIGDFKFDDPKEETPEEVRKSRADAIWEALHSVAKPN